MILYPIIDLLKRIVVALPEYVKPSGGGILSDSGQVVLASADSSTHLIVSGLSFTPNAFYVMPKHQ